MKIPENLKYSEEHEWVSVKGANASVGITDYAQNSLGDIVYVELPKVGALVKKGQEVTTIESVKAASAIYSPVTGKIVEVNKSLDQKPELINQDPYGAFIFVVEMKDPSELNGLLDAAAYKTHTEKSGH